MHDDENGVAHENHRSFWRELARVCGGTVEDVPGGLVVETGIHATGFNQVHCRGNLTDESVIAYAAAYFRRTQLAWRIVSERPNVAADTFAIRHGVEREPLYPILSMAVDGSVTVPETPLSLTTAGDLADLRAFVDCAAAGYRMDSALLKPIVHKRALANDRLRFHLGWVGGRCVAVSVGMRCGETVGVYFVAVRREHRRSGFGAAITEYAISNCGDGKPHTAVLQATSAGYPLYIGMGFTKIADYYLWDLPATAQM